MTDNHENEKGSLPMFLTIIIALAILGGGYIYLSSNSPRMVQTNGSAPLATNQQPVNPFNPINSYTDNTGVDASNDQSSQNNNSGLLTGLDNQTTGLVSTNADTQNVTAPQNQQTDKNLNNNSVISVYNSGKSSVDTQSQNIQQQTNEQLLNSIQASLISNGSNLNGQNNTDNQDGSTGSTYTKTVYDTLNDSSGTSSGGSNSNSSGSNSSGGIDMSGMLGGITSGGSGNSSGGNNNNNQSNTKPFGGSVTQVTRCTCGPSSLIYIKSVGSGSGGGGGNGQLQLLYTPGQSQLYANYDINSTGENVVGTYSQGGSQCQVYSGTSCRSEGNPSGTISKVGTSQSQGM